MEFDVEIRRAEALTSLHRALAPVVTHSTPEVAFEMGRRYTEMQKARTEQVARECGEILVHLSDGNDAVKEAVDTLGELTWTDNPTPQRT